MPNHIDDNRREALGLVRRPLALLAEDDLDVQEALASFLLIEGYDVVTAGNGADMLDALARSAGDVGRDADVIVTDVRMPGMNGLSIAEELRADGWRQPIVIISAYDDALLLSRVRGLRRCAFFAKPLDPERFVRVLDELRFTRWPATSSMHRR